MNYEIEEKIVWQLNEATEKLVILNRHHESDGGFTFPLINKLSKKDLQELCRIHNLEMCYVIDGKGWSR